MNRKELRHRCGVYIIEPENIPDHMAATFTALLNLIEGLEKRVKELENKPQLKEQVFSADSCEEVICKNCGGCEYMEANI